MTATEIEAVALLDDAIKYIECARANIIDGTKPQTVALMLSGLKAVANLVATRVGVEVQ